MTFALFVMNSAANAPRGLKPPRYVRDGLLYHEDTKDTENTENTTYLPVQTLFVVTFVVFVTS